MTWTGRTVNKVSLSLALAMFKVKLLPKKHPRLFFWMYMSQTFVKCDLTGKLEEQSTITHLPVGSHSGSTFFVCHDGAPEIQLLMCAVKNLLFSKLCVHKQCSQCSCSCVETLVILCAEFHVVSSLLSVLKIAIQVRLNHRPWYDGAYGCLAQNISGAGDHWPQTKMYSMLLQ